MAARRCGCLRCRRGEALVTRVKRLRLCGRFTMGGAAFNTVPSEVLFGVFEARHKASRPSLVYCGDDSSSKEIAAALIRDVRFDPVDAGPLRIARYTEPFALLVGQLAYEGKEGRNWRTDSSGSGDEAYHVRTHRMGQFLRNRRFGRWRADRIAVRRHDAYCREATDTGGRGRRRV